ncbi:MAG: pre-peptidase C-terminal domain-containing protein, partial [Robiginitomaculum sp.]|nr:pre-peptidase C-terminal domain-containing protein [Robiginitomaculum sp.]
MRFFSQTDLTTNSEMDFSTVEWGDNASSNSPANNKFDAGIVVNTDYSVAFSQWTLEPISFGFDEFFVEFNLSSVVVDKPLFVDIPGDLSTTAVLTVGGSVSDTLEVSADQDWFAITLVAGQRYSFALDGSGASPLSDPLVRILDNTGLELQTNDDGGTGLNSLLTYTATYSGTYYISAQAYNDGTNPTSTGDYTLTSAELPPLAERDIDGIANFLTDEFSTRASYNTGGGGTTTINFSFASGANSLSAGAEALARRALDAWSEVANIIFVEGPGDIVFRDNGSGAFNSNTRSGSTILSSDLNISSTWNGGNLNVDSYTYQTFLHEIGHSLGLGHAGPYNGDATYGID